MTTAEWMAQQTPSADRYPSIDLEKIKNRSPKFTGSHTPRFKPLMASDAPSPVSYSPVDKLRSEQSPRVKFATSPKKGYLDEHVKRKNFVPSVSQYDTDRGQHRLTQGAFRGYK